MNSSRCDSRTRKPAIRSACWCSGTITRKSLDSKNTEITADFPYYVVKHLRESQKCPVAYFTGTVGGLMTTLRLSVKDENGKELADGTFEKSDRYGKLVAQLADKALKNAVPLALTPFDTRARQILVPVDNNLYRLASQFGTLDRQMYVVGQGPDAEGVQADERRLEAGRGQDRGRLSETRRA